MTLKNNLGLEIRSVLLNALKNRAFFFKAIMKKTIIGLLIMGLFLLGNRLAWAESTNRIIAIVNDEIITFHELEKAKRNFKLPDLEKERKEEFDKQLLFQLIDQKLIDLQIKRLGIQINPEEVDKAIARIKEEQGLNSPEEFSKVLLQEGLSESEFRNKIKEQILAIKTDQPGNRK